MNVLYLFTSKFLMSKNYLLHFALASTSNILCYRIINKLTTTTTTTNGFKQEVIFYFISFHVQQSETLSPLKKRRRERDRKDVKEETRKIAIINFLANSTIKMLSSPLHRTLDVMVICVLYPNKRIYLL